jgi:hypothetical protein
MLTSCAAGALAGCGLVDPGPGVEGRYDLVGCTYFTTYATDAPSECTWSTGGGTSTYKAPAYLEFMPDGRVVQSIDYVWQQSPAIPTPNGVPAPPRPGTLHVTGQWTLHGGRLSILWDGSVTPLELERVDTDTIRDAGIASSAVHFWFARSR